MKHILTEEREASPGNTTYYVDPAGGSDQQSGTEAGRAWRTFAPVNRLALAPGDRIEILAPGSFDQTLALTGAGTVESPITVHFAPGRYDLHRAGALKLKYHISNTNGDPEGEKAIGILIANARHLIISGPGARVVYRGKMIEVCIDHSEDITISDLQFDYHRPTVSEFTVTDAAADHADLAIHRDSHYRATDGRIVWQGEGWSYGVEEMVIAQQLDLDADRVWRCPNPLKELRIEELAPHVVRAHGRHEMMQGRVFQLRNGFRDCVGIFIRRSRNVTFRQVDFYFLHGMGVLCQFSADITLDSVRIAPEEESGRTCAAWADCMHFSGCRGRIVVKDCLFSGANDDAINIHGTYLRVVEEVAANQVKVRFMHRQTYGFMAFNPGDEIEFVRWDTMETYAPNRVTAADLLDPWQLLLTLERPVPPDRHEGDVIENVTWTPEVEISGCTVRRIPTRGFLLTTRRRVRVTGNDFLRPHMNGIDIESDAEGWFESGCVRDMVISRNRFVHCGKQAILISPRNSEPNDSVHRNIRIMDNEFVRGDGACVEARSTEALRIEGNKVYSSAEIDEAAAFQTSDCCGATVQNNTFLPPASTKAEGN